MYIIGPVRTAHFGRCRSFPNRFRIRRKAAADLGGGYFFRSTPNLIAAITSISNAMVSVVLMRSPPFYGETTVPFLLANSIIHGSPCFVNFLRRPLGGFCYVCASPPVLHRTHGKFCGTCRRIDPPAFSRYFTPFRSRVVLSNSAFLGTISAGRMPYELYA